MPNLTPLVSDEYVRLGAASGQERLHTSHLLLLLLLLPLHNSTCLLPSISEELNGDIGDRGDLNNSYYEPLPHVKLSDFTANARMTSHGNRRDVDEEPGRLKSHAYELLRQSTKACA
jgi:hypothetical protein